MQKRLSYCHKRIKFFRGVTLVELVAVMILVGILAAMAIPRINFIGDFDSRSLYDQVRATVEYARKAAIAERRYVCVRTAAGTMSFTVDTRSPETTASFCNGSAEIALALPARDAKCGAANQVCQGGRGGALSGSALVIFDPLGSSTGGTFTVSGMGTITVTANTGYVR